MPVRYVQSPDAGERLLTAHEAAELVGVTYRSWRVYMRREYAPEPDAYVGNKPLWREPKLRAWDEQR